MRIGILGSGLMGGKLGTLFARAGHEVVFSYSRSRKKLERLARDAGGNARAGTPREAAQDADVVLLAVHWNRVDDVLRRAGDAVHAKQYAFNRPAERTTRRPPGRFSFVGGLSAVCLIVAQLAYEGDEGPALAYRFERFEERT